jgi:hypothetical protein
VARAFEALGADGAAMMARWLPQLVPQARWGMLHAQPSFQALLGQLAPEVALAVAEAAAQTPEAASLRRVQRSLGDLLAQAEATPGGVEALMGLVDNALKSLPLVQESSGDWAAWVGAVLEGLHALLVSEPPPGWGAADLAQLFRTFPRVLDCGAAASFALMHEVLAVATRRALSFEAVQGSLRGLKFSERRVTQDTIRRWAEVLR